MAKKKKPVAELADNKEDVKNEYGVERRKFQKAPLLTKKEKKALGIGRDEGRASAKHLRVPASKAKLVLDLIRGKDLEEAYGIVKYTPRAASEFIMKLLESAEANAVNNFELDKEKLYVAEAYAGQGTTLKRIKANARGSASRIRKRTSHITVVLKERA
jgi:large subunit ribosomal protein L22